MFFRDKIKIDVAAAVALRIKPEIKFYDKQRKQLKENVDNLVAACKAYVEANEPQQKGALLHLQMMLSAFNTHVDLLTKDLELPEPERKKMILGVNENPDKALPPVSEISQACQKILYELGLHISQRNLLTTKKEYDEFEKAHHHKFTCKVMKR